MAGEHENYWPDLNIVMIDPVTGDEASLIITHHQLKKAMPDPSAMIMNLIRQEKAHLYREAQKEQTNE